MSIISEVHLTNMKTNKYGEIKRIFLPNQSWGFKTFIKKDSLENHMKNFLDTSGRLNIHLKLSCKNELTMLNKYGQT